MYRKQIKRKVTSAWGWYSQRWLLYTGNIWVQWLMRMYKPCKGLREEGFMVEYNKCQGPGLRMDLESLMIRKKGNTFEVL